VTQIKCTATNVGPTLFCADVDGLKMFADAPSSYGGNGTTMTPPQAQVATLANCVGIVIAVACKNKGIPYEGMSVEAIATLDAENHCLNDFNVEIRMPGEVTDQMRRAVNAAHEMCSIGNTMCAANSVNVALIE